MSGMLSSMQLMVKRRQVRMKNPMPVYIAIPSPKPIPGDIANRARNLGETISDPEIKHACQN